MMSENINKKFFEGDVADEYDYERDDGKIEVRRKGTIAILEEWIDRYFRPGDDGPANEMKTAFRKVRKGTRQFLTRYLTQEK